MLLTTIFSHVDDFCKNLGRITEKELIVCKKRPGRKSNLSPSEIMTILIFFHHSKMRTFKDFYKIYIKTFERRAFPSAPSYHRFIELIPQCLMPLYLFINFCRLGGITGISFIDSTPLKVCHNLRIRSNKVFKGLAKRGKTSTGWFYGFKLHLIINENGEILAFNITTANCDDRNEKNIDILTQNISGKLFGDKGYLSTTLFKKLYAKGISLVTKLKKGMKNILMQISDKLLLKKRGIIESVNDLLKNACQIEHTRHRSPINFLVHLLAGLAAYSFLEKKPSLKKTDIVGLIT